MIKEYGYEYNAVLNDEVFSKTQWNSTNKTLWGAYCLRSGRDALKVIAKAHSGAHVYLPSLCCDSMITPFVAHNCKVEFYTLTESLTVNYACLFKMLETVKGEALLLYYEYFGLPMFSDAQIKEIKTKFKNVIIIKDVTHTLLSNIDSEKHEDYTIASLRKWTNVPDGGLLWSKHKVDLMSLSESPTFATQRLKAQKLRTLYFATGNEEIKKQYREIFSNVSLLLDSDKTPAKMTEYSYQIAKSTDWNEIRKIRRENSIILRNAFNNCGNVKTIDACVNESNLYVPILVNNRDEIQASLSNQKIFNTIIWPLREAQKKCCKNASYVNDHMLAVPCDQRYSKEDMIYISKEIVRTISEKNNDIRGKHITTSCNKKSNRNGA